MSRLGLAVALLLAAPGVVLAQDGGVPDAALPEAPGGLTSPAASSPFAHVAVEQGHVVVGIGTASPRVVDTGCVARAALGAGNELHVACEGGLVRTYGVGPDGALSPPSDRRVGAEVRALFVLDGQVWVEYARVEAQPLASLGMGGGGATSATTTGAPHVGPLADAGEAASAMHAANVRGEVISVNGMRAVTSLGREQGIRIGQHVELGDGEDELVVGVVREATPERSTVELGMGETVRVGASARAVTRGTTDHFLAPRRSGSILSFGGTTRLLVPLGGLGIGSVNDAWAAWHASGPFALRLRLMPFGGVFFHPSESSGTIEPDSTAGAFSGALEGMFDSDFFGLGVGVGVGQYAQGGYCTGGGFGGYPCPTVEFGFAITQVLRIGAIDGLNLVVNNHVVVIRNSIEYGGTEGQIQIPVAHAWWLVIRGGGSVIPFGFTELGMRIATSGNGGDGTLFVTPTIGWAGIATPSTYGTSLRAGPTVGVGFEYRLGV